jgi:Group II intron, maturase-specific domain
VAAQRLHVDDVQRARDPLRELTDRKRKLLPVKEVVWDANNDPRGWANYYRYGNSRLHFTKISTYALTRSCCSWPNAMTALAVWLDGHELPLANQLGLISLDEPPCWSPLGQ